MEMNRDIDLTIWRNLACEVAREEKLILSVLSAITIFTFTMLVDMRPQGKCPPLFVFQASAFIYAISVSSNGLLISG